MTLLGLEGVRNVGGSLILEENDVLVDVEALHGVVSIGLDLLILGNGLLVTADAEALRDAIGVSDIGGTVTISGNAP